MGELIIGKSIEKDLRLWRYMSLDKLINLLSTQTLYFTPLLYYQESDPFEGYIPKVGLQALAGVFAKEIHDIEKTLHTLNEMYEKSKSIRGRNPNVEQGLEKLKENIDLSDASQLDLMRKVSKSILVNCWHSNENESEAMWKLYSDNGKGIAITTNSESLKKSIEPLRIDKKIFMGKVKYLNFYDSNLEPKDCLVDGHLAALTKRESYKHEEEVRLFTVSDIDYDNIEKIAPKPLILPARMQDLIKEVYISPFAKEPFISSTIKICRIYGISDEKIHISKLLDEKNYLAENYGHWRDHLK